MKTTSKFVVSILILSLYACSSNAVLPQPTLAPTASLENTPEQTATTSADYPSALPETEILLLNLPERFGDASFEYSGLGWYEDNLSLLPQYPAGKDFSREAALFSISKSELVRNINQPDYELSVREVPILNSDLRSKIRGFEGFESILFVENDVYLTIESRAGSPMMGYLIKGVVDGDLTSITLDPDSLIELTPFTSESNESFETMTYWDGCLYIIYEHNSNKDGSRPRAYQFNTEDGLLKEVAFPELDFRVTDATNMDANGRFWVINYFYPGDTHLAVNQDLLVLEYGEGQTHGENETVERLVELQVEDGQVSRIDQAPLYLQLLDDNTARNWEGIVRLDDLGFVVVTDSFPDSLLGFYSIIR